MEREVELTVEMTCEGCAKSVTASLQGLPGVSNVVADVKSQTVVVKGTADSGSLLCAATGSGFKAKISGHGSTQGFEEVAARFGCSLQTLQESLTAVAEFKGKASGHGDLFGAVRLLQATPETCQVEGNLDGLSPGTHKLAIHTLGDLRNGFGSVGNLYSAGGVSCAGEIAEVTADAQGRAFIPLQVIHPNVKVWDVIGRALVVDGVPNSKGDHNAAAAVIARGASVGVNHKKLCSCDGTVIWNASPLQL